MSTDKDMRHTVKLPAVERKMRSQWDNTETGQTPDAQAEERIWREVGRRTFMRRHRILFHPIVRIAACVAFLFVTYLWLTQKPEEKQQAYSQILASEQQLVTLADSSRVWMAAGSTIRYTEPFATDRRVWLTGDATFEVRKNDYPFKVFLNGAFIEVKGTTFRVTNAESPLKEVELFEGKIDFHIPEQGKSIPMNPHQRLVFDAGNGQTDVSYMGPINWKDGKYIFENMRLDTLVNNIAHIYRTSIRLAKGINANELFNGTIRIEEPLENVLKKLCYNLNIRFKTDKEEKGYLLY